VFELAAAGQARHLLCCCNPALNSILSLTLRATKLLPNTFEKPLTAKTAVIATHLFGRLPSVHDETFHLAWGGKSLLPGRPSVAPCECRFFVQSRRCVVLSTLVGTELQD
jgi:hypothetical protein